MKKTIDDYMRGLKEALKWGDWFVAQNLLADLSKEVEVKIAEREIERNKLKVSSS